LIISVFKVLWYFVCRYLLSCCIGISVNNCVVYTVILFMDCIILKVVLGLFDNVCCNNVGMGIVVCCYNVIAE